MGQPLPCLPVPYCSWRAKFNRKMIRGPKKVGHRIALDEPQAKGQVCPFWPGGFG